MYLSQKLTVVSACSLFVDVYNMVIFIVHFRALEHQLLLVASHFIQKDKERREPGNRNIKVFLAAQM